MSDIIEQGFWYKVRYTPLRDALRGRMTARLDLGRQLEKAGLPPPVNALLARVVKGTRLWRLERVEVMRELIAHFSDGMASGVSSEELLQKFGDEAQAAKLIRRAKRRNRPMAWHTLRIVGWAAGLLLAFYSGYAVYFFSGQPSLRINYAATINKGVEDTPVADRAWPLYRRALIGVDARSQSISSLSIDATAKSEERSRLLKLIGDHRAEVEWIREGAAKPSFGWLVGAKGSRNDPELLGKIIAWPGQTPATDDPDLSVELTLPPLSGLRDLATMLRLDGMLARETGDGKRLLQDIHSTFNLSRQLAENAPLLSSLISLSIFGMGMDQIEQTLHERPTLIQRQDWIALIRRLSAPKVAADLMTFEPERIYFDDTLQRTFTDDGSGNGRLTATGIAYLLPFEESQKSWFNKVAQPAAGLLAPSRKTLKKEYSQALDIAEANLKLPLRNADWHSVQQIRSLTHFPIIFIIPTYARVQTAAERELGRRDGVVTGIALELYRQDHGKYPESLNALVPEFLPEVPTDRITGGPLQYRLVSGQPLLYSVGADRKDDEGRYTFEPRHAAIWVSDDTETPKGDWVLYPTLGH